MSLHPWNFLSYLVYYATTHGISEKTLAWILMLPIIATVVVILRQFLGVKTFGIYIPSIITISFLAVGLRFGLVLFLVILILGTILRVLLKKLRLLYLSRMAILLMAVSLATVFLVLAAIFIKPQRMTEISVFPMIVMIILVERFVEVQIEKGYKEAALLTVETLIIAIAGYFLLIWQKFQDLILHYPGIVLLILLTLNIILGRWTGLRAVEYWRFRKLLRT